MSATRIRRRGVVDNDFEGAAAAAVLGDEGLVHVSAAAVERPVVAAKVLRAHGHLVAGELLLLEPDVERLHDGHVVDEEARWKEEWNVVVRMIGSNICSMPTRKYRNGARQSEDGGAHGVQAHLEEGHEGGEAEEHQNGDFAHDQPVIKRPL